MVNRLAQERGIGCFKQHCIHSVPFPNPGMGRKVYPGFLQCRLHGHEHRTPRLAHFEMFNHLVEGDGDSAERHRDFYDEYLAVMDLTAEFYLQTVEEVFVKHAIPLGLYRHRGAVIDLHAIHRTAIFTVEGEKDDIREWARHMRRRSCAPRFPRRGACIMCRKASAITASSTARASARNRAAHPRFLRRDGEDSGGRR